MSNFDADKQNKKIEELKEQEEESLVAMMAENSFGVPYVNLASMSIDNDALRVVSLEEAKEFEVGPFNLVGKKLSLAVL